MLCLTEVVSPDELRDDEDYEDIMEDMRTECGKFGKHFLLIISPMNSYVAILLFLNSNLFSLIMSSIFSTSVVCLSVLQLLLYRTFC